MRGGVAHYTLTNTSSQISHKPTGNENLTQCVNVGFATELSELRTLYGRTSNHTFTPTHLVLNY